MSRSILKDKSYAFAIRIVKLSRHLQADEREFVLSKQILQSGDIAKEIAGKVRSN